MQFQEYHSKPIVRSAFQLTKNHLWHHVVGKASTYKVFLKEKPEDDIEFKAYEEPKEGDWVVRLTTDDTYHVTDAVFRERNIVEAV